MAALAIGGLLLISLALQPPGFAFVGTAVVGLLDVLASSAWLLSTWTSEHLSYELDGEQFTVRWPGGRARVPLGLVDGVYGGQRVSAELPAAFRWLPGVWPYWPARNRAGHRLIACSTSAEQSLVVVTAGHLAVIVSPVDSARFRRVLIDQAQRTEPLDPEDCEAEVQLGVPWSALADRWWAAVVGPGLGLWLLACTVLSATYSRLPSQLPLRFDASGHPVDMGTPSDLTRLVLGGLVVLALDTAIGAWLHASQRALGRVTWIVGAGLQLMVLIGLAHFLP